MNPALIQILNSTWLIHADNHDAYGAMIIALLNGSPINEESFSAARERNRPFLVLNSTELLAGTRTGIRSTVTDQVTAVVPIRGEIMKDDQECGPRGSISIASDIKTLDSNPQVGSILLIIDSPGGQVTGTDLLSQAIADCKKPVIAFVEGMAASAAYWIASASDKIIASSSLDRIGSIGTMLSLTDLNPAFEKMGVKFHEVYATNSPDKNQDYKDIVAGKYDQYRKDTLDVINAKFHGMILSHRPGIDQKALTGKIFFAPQAIEFGLIDEIGTLEYAFSLCKNSHADKLTAIEKPNMKIKFTSALAAIADFFGFAETSDEQEITPEMLEQVSDRLSVQNSTIDSMQVSIDNLTGELSVSNETVANLTAALAAETSAHAQVTADFEAFKASDFSPETLARKAKDEFDAKASAEDQFLHNRLADQQA